MSHDAGKTTDEHLVYMANQIATFFESQSAAMAASGVADHINNFWEPRMRRRLFELADKNPEALKPLVIEALPSIRRPKEVASTD